MCVCSNEWGTCCTQKSAAVIRKVQLLHLASVEEFPWRHTTQTSQSQQSGSLLLRRGDFLRRACFVAAELRQTRTYLLFWHRETQIWAKRVISSKDCFKRLFCWRCLLSKLGIFQAKCLNLVGWMNSMLRRKDFSWFGKTLASMTIDLFYRRTITHVCGKIHNNIWQYMQLSAKVLKNGLKTLNKIKKYLHIFSLKHQNHLKSHAILPK